MERFRSRQTPEDEDEEKQESAVENYVKDDGEWWYVKKGGQWRPELLPASVIYSRERAEEVKERHNDFLAMVREGDQQWKESDEAHKNEGFLREHPRYKELYIKWAIRYLRHKGYDKRVFTEKIRDDEGELLTKEGRHSGHWLVNETANGREWIDEFVMFELHNSEGFVDITNDYERREELGIDRDYEPEYGGWWMSDEI